MRRLDTETWESVSTALGRVQGGRWGVESLSQRGRQSPKPLGFLVLVTLFHANLYIFLVFVTRNHWQSMSAVPLFGARYTFSCLHRLFWFSVGA